MARQAEAEWKGDLKGGVGRVKLGSGAYEGNYSFATRFENGSGANPEELVGAALAGCYGIVPLPADPRPVHEAIERAAAAAGVAAASRRRAPTAARPAAPAPAPCPRPCRPPAARTGPPAGGSPCPRRRAA